MSVSVWRPSASLAVLRARAAIMARVRQFFAERNVLEVETPLLAQASVTDPHIISIPAAYRALGAAKEQVVYLQTSPEYAMKRLLAAGAGDIYQITKAFRQGEVGPLHNPEFTLLEWYRLGFDHHQLMDEVAALIGQIIAATDVPRFKYGDMFKQYVGVDPYCATMTELKECVRQQGIHVHLSSQDVSDQTECNFWLDVLFTHCVEPYFSQEGPVFLYDFPSTQAGLAKIRDEKGTRVASRFELYFKGIELANGFHELQDADEQRARFEKDLAYRALRGIVSMPVDERFLAALTQGLPDCAGVALGIDRLVMLVLEQHSIADVLSFDFARS